MQRRQPLGRDVLDVALPGIQHVHLDRIDIEAGDTEALAADRLGQRQADIAEPDDADIGVATPDARGHFGDALGRAARVRCGGGRGRCRIHETLLRCCRALVAAARDGGAPNGVVVHAPDGKFDVVPLLFLHAEQELHQVGADGEVAGIAGDDEGFEVGDGFRSRLESLGDEADDIAAEGVHLGVVDERGSGILFDDSIGFLDRRNRRDAGSNWNRLVGVGDGVEKLAAGGRGGVVFVPGVGGLEERRDVPADGQELLLHLLCHGARADGIHHLEWAKLPVEAGAHCGVDGDDVSCGFGCVGRDAIGRVSEEFGKEWPVECRGSIFGAVAGDKLRDAGCGGFYRFGLLQRRELRPGAGDVFEGVVVEHEADVAALLVAAGFLVEALPGLVAEPLVLQHLHDERRDRDIGAFVVRAVGLRREVVCYVGEDVHADEVAQTEGARARESERRARQRINFFDGEFLLHHQADGVAHSEGADAVGDEVGGVAGLDDGLAEALVGELRDERDVVGVGVGCGDDLEQPHVPRRIEEVGAEPVFVEFVGEAVGDICDRETGGVGGGDRARLAVDQDFLQQSPLDFKVFGYDFDDPVAGGNEREIVVEVAERDQASGVRREKCRGFRLFQAVERSEDELVAGGSWSVGGGSRWHDIEENHWNSGVCDVCCDSGTHGSGA